MDEHQATGGPPLFNSSQSPIQSSILHSTSRLAGEVAAKMSGSRRAKIVQLLTREPLTIFEIAARLGIHEHQISGRFSELEREGVIRKNGQRRRKPETQCDAEVYELAPATTPPAMERIAGYPDTLIIAEEGTFEREPLLQTDADLPGIPYATRGPTRLVWRVMLIECACGRPLKLVMEGNRKTYRCGSPTCRSVWEGTLIHEPGGQQLLALVRKHL